MMQHEQHHLGGRGDGAVLGRFDPCLIRFLQTVYHRKVYVISALVVAGLLGGLYYTTATPIYQATPSC
jgi:hypothetical protein